MSKIVKFTVDRKLAAKKTEDERDTYTYESTTLPYTIIHVVSVKTNPSTYTITAIVE